ncbi:MAG: F-box/LRR-repeat protein [Thermodesulfobacteriota bacterium]
MSSIGRLCSIASDPLQLLEGAKASGQLSPEEGHQLAERIVKFLDENKGKIFQHKDETRVKEAVGLLHQKCQVLDAPRKNVVDIFFSSYFRQPLSEMPVELLVETLSELDIPDLDAAARSSYELYRLARDNDVWRSVAAKIGFQPQVPDTRPVYNQVREYIFDLRKKASKFPGRPGYIRAILRKKPTIENTVKLKALMKARDTAVVWRKLADAIRATAFTKLETLGTDAERIAQADGFDAWIETNKVSLLASVRILGLLNLNLTALPEAICRLTSLQQILLQSNQLEKLPETFGNLIALQSLDLSYNRLKELPNTFGNLSAVTHLYLSNNQLEKLPETFGNLAALGTLTLPDNRLEGLPATFSKLTALQRLNLARNQLKGLPNTFGNFTALQGLHLVNNQLEELPETFSNLTALQSLGLAHNRLKKLPETFGNFTALRVLDVDRSIEIPEEVSALLIGRGVEISRL